MFKGINFNSLKGSIQARRNYIYLLKLFIACPLFLHLSSVGWSCILPRNTGCCTSRKLPTVPLAVPITPSCLLETANIQTHDSDPKGGGVEPPPSPSLKNHKWLSVSLEILQQTPLGKQLDPKRSNCFSWEVLMALCKYNNN